MRIVDNILPEFDMEMANTRKVIAAANKDKFDWKPHEKSFSLGALAGHFPETLGWATGIIAEDSFDMAPVDGPAYESPTWESIDQVLQAFDDGVAAARAALDGASDQVMMSEWKMFVGGEEKMAMPKVAVIRGFILNHLIHHRGQLTVYLRLSGSLVPATYGPSADEAGM